VMRESRNVFIAMGMCMVLTTAFTAVVIGMQFMGKSSLVGPAIAVWAPLIIFVPIAVGLTDTLST
jgi:lipopolysaccharide export system permease protein